MGLKRSRSKGQRAPGAGQQRVEAGSRSVQRSSQVGTEQPISVPEFGMWGRSGPLRGCTSNLPVGREPRSTSGAERFDRGVSKNTFRTSDDRNNSVTLRFVVQS